MSKSKKGKKITNQETLKKMSKRMQGENNPMYGRHLFGESNGFFGKKHSEEFKKKMSESRKGKNIGEDNATSIRVLCIESNKIYNSMREAGQATGTLPQNISKCCNGQRKTAGGYHWQKILE